MKKTTFVQMTCALLAIAASSHADFAFTRAFTSNNTEIPAPSVDATATGATAAWATINHMVVEAGVDTDGDGNEEIVVFRIDSQAATITTGDLGCIYIYERTTGDNGYALKYSDCYTNFDSGNFNDMGHMVIGDLDGANGQEIIIIPSDRFSTVPLRSTFVVYASSGNDTWGSGNTAANNQFSQEVLIGPAGTSVTSDTTTNNEQQGAAIGDFDGDSANEIAIAIDRTNETLIASVSSGTWVAGNAVVVDETAGGLAGAGGSPFAMLAIDTNGDGRKEAVTGYFNSVGLGVYEGTAANTYALGRDLSPGIAPADRLVKPGALVGADIDGNGTANIFAGNARTGEVYTLDGLTTGSVSTLGALTVFAPAATFTGTVDPGTDSNGELLVCQDLAIGDGDGNGRRELLHAFQPSAATAPATQIYAFEYNGTGSATDVANYTLITGTTSGLTAAETIFAVTAADLSGATLDMDNDGLSEVVITTAGVTEPALIVFEETPPARVENWEIMK
ncbi:MAG: hypothetical protein SFY68_06855 [Candidatus Sumerlaeia bacterium]|nr:hypothetical protein [Candidatus Sumerlaeia bacterium]